MPGMMLKMFKKLTSILPLVGFLIIYLMYALMTFRTYGITWDESDVYSSGRMTWAHLATRLAPDEPLLVAKTPGSEIRAVYNSSYAAVLYKLNKGESFERYHLYNMLFNALGFVAAYALLYKYYKNPWYALIGPLFLALTPRYFGDFPANPKDAPFATMYLVVLTAVYYLVDLRDTYLRMIVLGGLIGTLQSMRILGINMLGMLFGYETYLFLQKHLEDLNIRRSIKWLWNTILRTSIIGALAMFITTISWPYLGSSFLKHLLDILKTSREYPWLGGTLTRGELMLSYDLPLSYLPTWIMATTPIFILLLSALALFRAFKTNFRHPLYFLLISALIMNFSMFYLSNPHVYDGLRHFMFVLPLMAVLAATCFIEILEYAEKRVKYGVIALVILNALLVGRSYITLYPYQYVYFNELVGGLHKAAGKYETDYWGSSFREATLWLKEHTKNEGKTVMVFTCAHPFISNYYFGDNMQWTDNTKTADYSICYTRSDEHLSLSGEVIHVVKRDGVGLNYITKKRSL